MNNPFFTIGIPVYNAEKYLSDCLESILTQSFTDFELVLVNDGSTDSSPAICQEYAAKDSRIKVFHYENGGISVASNRILDKCTGKYVFLMDNDDTMVADALKNAFDTISLNGYPDLLRTNFVQISSDKIKEFILPKPEDGWNEMTADERVVHLLYKNRMPYPTWTKFIRRDVIENNNLKFNKDYNGCQDADFTLRVCRKCENISFGDFFSVNWFHPRRGSVSTKYNLQNTLNLFNLYNDYRLDFKNWNLPEEAKKKAELLFLGDLRVKSIIANQMKYNDAKTAAQALEKMVGKDFRKLTVSEKGQFGILYRLYNIIGVKNTILLFNKYLRAKKAIE